MATSLRARAGNLRNKDSDLPDLTKQQWMRTQVLGGVFLLMAVLQIISFTDFKDTLDTLGVTSATEWAICVIIAEVVGALCFFKIPLTYLARSICIVLAILAAGFWFVLNLQSLSSGLDVMPSLGLFGGFLNQSPGWWTTIETSVLLVWTLHTLSLMMPGGSIAKR